MTRLVVLQKQVWHRTPIGAESARQNAPAWDTNDRLDAFPMRASSEPAPRQGKLRLTDLRVVRQSVIPERRPISEQERDVIVATVQRACIVDFPLDVGALVANLQVVGRCGCGCATIHFAAPHSIERAHIIADAAARTPRGGQVGVIVWGRPDAITCLEIYDLGADADDLALPLPATIARL